ncbi:YveK family protein [Arthrobacter sp. MMS24-T111]
MLQPVIDSLGLAVTADQLAKQVKASTDLDTVVINISVVDNSPVQAAAIAQAIGNSLIKVVDDLERPKLGGASPVKLSVITPATPPGSPTSPNTRLNLVLGACLGLIAGLALAFGRKAIDTKVRGESDVSDVSSSPIIGGISYDPDASKRPLLTQAPQHSRRAESYRQLRTNLQFANISGHAKTVLVTSSLPGEGKSTTAINLAIALAQAGQSVCLVDADLRRPMVGEYLGLDATAGLTTALVGAADVNELLHVWGSDNLCV